MKASQLRDLSRQHASGEIDRAQYRAARRKLIEAVTSGELQLRYRDIHLPEDPVAPDARWRRLGLVLLLGLLLAAIGVYVLGRPEASAPRPVAAGNGATLLVQQFLAGGDWSEVALAEFEQAWLRADAFQKEGARRSAHWRALRVETLRRLREQEALAAAGDREALLAAGRLRMFAERVGIRPGGAHST